jgi:glycosyltransferase involved in cell wall biosynthesis
LFAGRVAAEKGVREAIQVAEESNHRLLIIGPINHGSQGYFDQYVKPRLNERILYLGRMDQDQLPIYYQNAKAVLTPIQWEEPFGLTTVEAMACGTPVISLHRGAAPEIIKLGVTGFVVNSIAEMVEAVGKVDKIKASACRARVQNYFSTKQMVDHYEKAFSKAIYGPEKQNSKITKSFIKKNIQKVRRTLPKLGK